MKISLDEKEMESYIKAKQTWIEQNNGSFGIYSDTNAGEEKSVNFKILDVDKANNFLMQIMHGKDFRKEFADATGIEITSVNLYKATSDSTIEFIRDQLKLILNTI